MELPLPLPLALLVLGLVSGVHCVGMCGGIVGAFSAQPLVRRSELWKRQLAFNLGRVTSYGAAGAVAGTLGGLGAYVVGALPAQTALYIATNLVLIAVGLYFVGAGSWIARIEALGAPLWRRIQPLASRALQARSLPRVYLAGALWGWLPCSLVYAALGASVFAGGAAQGGLAGTAQGALAMLAFGAGTLPNLLAAGFAAARLQQWMKRPAVRAAAGAAVLASGAYGLAHAGGLADAIRRGLLCL